MYNVYITIYNTQPISAIYLFLHFRTKVLGLRIRSSAEAVRLSCLWKFNTAYN